MTAPPHANSDGTAVADPRVFSIEGRGLKLDSEADVKSIVDGLNARSDWEEVRLSGNTFGTPACRAIAEALRDKHALKICVFSDIFTGRLRSEIPHCVGAFTDALLHGSKPGLVAVDFSDNAFGPDCVRPLAPLIAKQTSLRSIRLNNTGLGPMGGQLLAGALADAAAKNKEEGKESDLRVIVAGRSRLENGSMPLMSKALQSYTHLREVVFPQDGIRPEGIVELLRGLAHCKELEVLDLQDNTFSTKGSRALAAALPNWPRLRVLNIGDCLLKAKGCLTFIAALAVSDNMQLEVLNLQYNEMREDGALALAKVLKRFPKLKSLEVNGNQFEEDGEGAEAIREALREMDTEDVLGTMSDMEEVDSSEEEESDGEDDGVSATEEEEAALELSADELADILGKTTITGAPSAAQ